MTLIGKWAFWCGVILVLAVGRGETWAQTVTSTGVSNSATIWAGGIDGFAIQWRTDRLDITRAGRPVLSFGVLAAREWSRIREHPEGQALTLEKTYAVLSDIGPWLSMQEGSFCDCGGAHSSAAQRFRTYDLSKSQTNRPALADLARIFPPDAVLSALLHNEAVTTVLKDLSMEVPRTLPDLVRSLAFQPVKVGDCGYFFDSALLSSFAFHRIESDKVAVRFGLPADGEVCRGELTQVEILLPVTEALRAQLLAAKDGPGGLLMEKMEGMDAGRITTFTFSYKPR